MRLSAAECQDLDRVQTLEWLEPNGRGGFASGTVAGANTRRYHALLLVARHPPAGRLVLVNHLDEWLHVGDERFPLSTNLYPGVVHPEGYRFCTGFRLDPWPIWTFQCGGLSLERDILCVHGRDVVVVRWRLLSSSRQRRPIRLTARPMLSGRDYHATHHENSALAATYDQTGASVRWHPYGDLPPMTATHNGRYSHAPEWFRRVQLPMEQARGLDGEEDCWSPGELSWTLTARRPATLLCAADPGPRDAASRLLRQERVRRRRADAAVPPTEDTLVATLWRATDAFLCKTDRGPTVLAGYPWFADWGRDTFIALPGLCLVTGRFALAKQIITNFAGYISHGMVPNRLPESGGEADYNTIDASLWFIDAVGRYVAATDDRPFVRQVAWPAVQRIVAGYREGTRYGIHVADDGLITGGEPGVQLTWMDAKVGDWVVTPRQGKPIEIQALWIRAMDVAATLAELCGEEQAADRCRQDACRARAAVRARFWYEGGGFLYDVIDGPEGDDASLRPNQLYALSLVDGLVTKEQARRILQAVTANLLTPMGLRTLAPSDPRYCPRYDGGVRERDWAYHQGTVWPFLLGPFITAWVKTHGATESVRTEARTFVAGFEAHLREAGLGQVSEIFDAEPPHHPRGCTAQAWSVCELLRLCVDELHLVAPRV